MNKKPTIVSKKTIYNAKYLKLDEVEVALYNNKKKTDSIASRSPAVYILPLTKNNELYLISQYRFMYEKRRRELIAGYIDEKEDPLTAAKRELIEEAGIRAKKWTLIANTEMSGSIINSNLYFYLAQELEISKAQPEEDEDIVVLKTSMQDAVDQVMENRITDLGSKFGILMVNQLQLQNKI